MSSRSSRCGIFMIFGTIVQDGDANKSRRFSRPSASGCRSWSAADDWVRVRGTIQVYDLAGTRILSHVDVHRVAVACRTEGKIDQTNRGTRKRGLVLSDDWVRVRGTIQVYDLAGTRILSHVDVHRVAVACRTEGKIDQTNRGTRKRGLVLSYSAPQSMGGRRHPRSQSSTGAIARGGSRGLKICTHLVRWWGTVVAKLRARPPSVA